MTETAPAALAETAPASKLRPLSPAERMRRSRDRRRKGLRLLAVELRESEIDALVRCGRLKSEDCGSPGAIRKALYGFLEDNLVLASLPFARARAAPVPLEGTCWRWDGRENA